MVKVVTRKGVNALPVKKKNILNVDELNAYKVAYGKPLKLKDYFHYCLVPGITFGVLSFLLLYYLWFSLIAFVIGVFYGFKVFLPKSVERYYETESFKQRNKFINNMTQILTDESKTVVKALSIVNYRTEGEFNNDLTILHASLMGANNKQAQNAFKVLAEKYEDDVVFIQYLEQLQTAYIEGRASMDTLKDIKTYHNEIKKKQYQYELKKQENLKGIKVICTSGVIFILALTFAFGFNTYINAFAHHPIGWITCGIYIALMFKFFRTFSTYLFDDSILEVEI